MIKDHEEGHDSFLEDDFYNEIFYTPQVEASKDNNANNNNEKTKDSKQENMEIDSLTNTINTNKNKPLTGNLNNLKQNLDGNNNNNFKRGSFKRESEVQNSTTARNKNYPDIRSFNTDKKERLFSLQDSIGEKIDDSERLMNEQLNIVKSELKDTRKQRDMYKKQFEDSIKFQDSKHTQLLSTLQSAFENLLIEVNITNKVKDYALIIMKILDYSELDQKRILEKKKKNMFSLFSTSKSKGKNEY